MPILSSRPLTLPTVAGMLISATLLIILTACTESTPANNSSSPAPHQTSATPASSGEAALPDPCQLLTKAEAESILGEPIGDPLPGGFGGNKICDYKTVKVHGGVLPYSIHLAIIGESQKVWDAGKQLHQQSDAKEMKPVSGIGDDAYFLLDSLEILSKQRYVSVNVLTAIDKPNHAKAVHDAELAVAQKAIPRLQ